VGVCWNVRSALILSVYKIPISESAQWLSCRFDLSLIKIEPYGPYYKEGYTVSDLRKLREGPPASPFQENSRSRPRVPDTRHEPEHIPYEEGNDRHGDFHDTEQAFLIKDKETMRGVSTRSER
jgi:hypothetical protein